MLLLLLLLLLLKGCPDGCVHLLLVMQDVLSGRDGRALRCPAPQAATKRPVMLPRERAARLKKERTTPWRW